MNIIDRFRERALSIDRNYSFHSISNTRLELDEDFFAHITDANIAVVQIKNVISQSCVLSRNAKVGKFRNYEKQNCYVAHSKNNYLVVVLAISWTTKIKQLTILDLAIFVDVQKSFEKSSISSTLFTTLVFSINLDTSIVSNVFEIIYNWWKSFANVLLSIFNSKILKRVTANEITIYENAIVYDRLSIVAKIYFTIWKNNEKSINISKKN